MHSKRFFLLSISVIVATGLVTAGLFGFIYTRGYRSDAVPSDAIVVLGAAVWGDGKPSPSLRGRTEKGIALYKQGLASRLVFSGGIGAGPPSEAEVMRRMAAAAGVPSDAIVIEDEAHSTKDSADYVADIAREHGWGSVIVVSDPFHTTRAKLIFQDVGLRVTTAGADDYYYSTENRVFYTLREIAALVSYEVGRIVS